MKMDGSPRLPALFTSRRRLLGMFACAPIAAVSASPAAAGRMDRITFTPSRVYDRGAWDAASIALERADADHQAACDYVEPFEQAVMDAEKQWHAIPAVFQQGDTVEMYNARNAVRREPVKVAQAAFGEAYERQAAACHRASDAYDDLMELPAPDMLAVLRKVELFIERDRPASEMATVAADLRRFAGVAA